MTDINRMQRVMSRLLTVGMLLSMLLVASGGMIYLWQFGNESITQALMADQYYPVSLQHIWNSARDLTAFGIINLGVVVLVMTQVLRVILLTGYYCIKRDKWFMLICFFILSVLIYSLFFR